jgi:hypothetical protein
MSRAGHLARLLGAVAVTATAPAGVLPASALGESSQTPESVAYGIDWLGRVPDERFGPASSRPVICLVDSGIAITPDTPATSDAGPIVARLNVYDGDPLAGDTEHGTRLAATIAAPRNDWGIVGIWPAAKIVSVKASEDGLFNSAAVLRGITMCRQWALANNRQLAVVNLSLGSPAVDTAYAVRWSEYTARVNKDGGSVVAAAGNTPGAGTDWPAAAEGTVAVGAGTADATGFCPNASHDALTRVVAPGCNTAAADPQGNQSIWPGSGSSTASAVTSAVLGALRALRPDVDHTTAEGWLTAGGALLDSARTLDGRAIAAAAGVTDLLTPTPQAPVLTADVSAELTSPTAVRVRLVGPRGRRKLHVTVPDTQIRSDAALEVAVRAAGRWRRATGGTWNATLGSVHALPARVWVRWKTGTLGTTASPWAAMRRPKSGAAARTWPATTPRGPKPPTR